MINFFCCEPKHIVESGKLRQERAFCFRFGRAAPAIAGGETRRAGFRSRLRRWRANRKNRRTRLQRARRRYEFRPSRSVEKARLTSARHGRTADRLQAKLRRCFYQRRPALDETA